MTCQRIRMPDGSVAIVCGSFKRDTKVCPDCGCVADYLCDFEVQVAGTLFGGTCDAPMCRQHATKIGTDLHHCPKHTGRALFEVVR